MHWNVGVKPLTCCLIFRVEVEPLFQLCATGLCGQQRVLLITFIENDFLLIREITACERSCIDDSLNLHIASGAQT